MQHMRRIQVHSSFWRTISISHSLVQEIQVPVSLWSSLHGRARAFPMPRTRHAQFSSSVGSKAHRVEKLQGKNTAQGLKQTSAMNSWMLSLVQLRREVQQSEYMSELTHKIHSIPDDHFALLTLLRDQSAARAAASNHFHKLIIIGIVYNLMVVSLPHASAGGCFHCGRATVWL